MTVSHMHWDERVAEGGCAGGGEETNSPIKKQVSVSQPKNFFLVFKSIVSGVYVSLVILDMDSNPR